MGILDFMAYSEASDASTRANEAVNKTTSMNKKVNELIKITKQQNLLLIKICKKLNIK